MKNHFFLLYTRYNGIDILSVKEKEILSSGSHSGPILPHIVLLFYITCLPSIISSFIYFFYCHSHLYKVGDYKLEIDWLVFHATFSCIKLVPLSCYFISTGQFALFSAIPSKLFILKKWFWNHFMNSPSDTI